MYRIICLITVLGCALTGCEMLEGSSYSAYQPAYLYPLPELPPSYNDPALQHRDYGIREHRPVDLKEVSRRARIEYQNNPEAQKSYDLLKRNIRARHPEAASEEATEATGPADKPTKLEDELPNLKPQGTGESAAQSPHSQSDSGLKLEALD